MGFCLFIVKKSVREYIEKYMVPQSTGTRASGQLHSYTLKCMKYNIAMYFWNHNM